MRPAACSLVLASILSIETATSSVAAETMNDPPRRPTDGTATASDHHHRQQPPPPPLTPETIEAYEGLNKWKGCLLPPEDSKENSGAQNPPPVRMAYEHNRSRAASTGFPSRLRVGSNLGLTDHETAAVFGWTTGDYRMINPIARGVAADAVVEFDEYPFLPDEMTRVRCRLSAADVMPYVRVLSSALMKLPALNCRQRLWRGHRRRIDGTPGSLVTLRGFTSVTRDRDRALEFAAKPDEGRSGRRTLLCIVDHFSARCVSRLSARPGEYEVMFPVDRTFEVVGPPEEDSVDSNTAREHLSAVRKAAEQLGKEMPGARIDLVYVREVGRPSRSDGLLTAR